MTQTGVIAPSKGVRKTKRRHYTPQLVKIICFGWLGFMAHQAL